MEYDEIKRVNASDEYDDMDASSPLSDYVFSPPLLKPRGQLPRAKGVFGLNMNRVGHCAEISLARDEGLFLEKNWPRPSVDADTFFLSTISSNVALDSSTSTIDDQSPQREMGLPPLAQPLPAPIATVLGSQSAWVWAETILAHCLPCQCLTGRQSSANRNP